MPLDKVNADEVPGTSSGTSPILYCWSARKLHPSIALYAAAVFIAFMALSHFVLHSTAAVKALALGAICFAVPLVPSVLSRVEYRLTASGLEKRPLNQEGPAAFKNVFEWSEIDHLVPLKYGFKFYKRMNESNPIRRFWKNHISDAFSGEVHLEAGDRDKVLRLLRDRDIPLR